MTTKTLIIKQLSRSPKTGSFDELNFEPGVNVLVGRPNTGKTQWLMMLDYLMGDRDNPGKAFNQELGEKYDSIRGTFIIDGKEIVLERKWKKKGVKTKVFIDKNSIGVDDFSSYLLNLLNIPVLHFPKGNPYSPNAWSELSWRMLLRHIYRKQTSWNDIANKQPEGEQLACLQLFLGIAEYLFSEEYANQVEKQKEINKLEAKKDQFVDTLTQISRQLVSEEELGVSVTLESINNAINRLENEIVTYEIKRDKILSYLKKDAEESLDSNSINMEELSEKLIRLESDREQIIRELKSAEKRKEQLTDYYDKVEAEISRMGRVQTASQIFSNYKVTHCPACGQLVSSDREELDTNHCCYLCTQPLNSIQNNSNAAQKRIEFEAQQLEAEKEEAIELIDVISNDINELESRLSELEEELEFVRSQIQPLRKAVVSIMPPEMTTINMELGRLTERIRQLERIKSVFNTRNQISEQIDNLNREIKDLKNQINENSKKINFQETSDIFVDKMNTYLNEIKKNNQDSWTQKQVNLRLKEKYFDFTINEKNWDAQLGATLKIYFLIAYNYALISLSNQDKYHYPGLTILDLPPPLEGVNVTYQENFLLEPFVKLLNKAGMENTQIIVAGSSFEGLKGVNRIELDKVWE